jgi:hypothetical protein
MGTTQGHKVNLSNIPLMDYLSFSCLLFANSWLARVSCYPLQQAGQQRWRVDSTLSP